MFKGAVIVTIPVPSSVIAEVKTTDPVVDSIVELAPVIVAAGVILIFPEVVTLEKEALLPPKIVKLLNGPLIAPPTVTAPPALRFKSCVPEIPPPKAIELEGASIKRVPVPPRVTAFEKAICPLVDSIVELAPVIVAAGVILMLPVVQILATEIAPDETVKEPKGIPELPIDPPTEIKSLALKARD